jgi:uncharacterized protein YdhG (YjbR/CyaY superfamily)
MPDSVDAYIAGFPEDVRALLTRMRETIQQAAPDAEERISYRMPAYKLQGILVYFAGYGKHIGFYPTASGVEAFKHELTRYKCAKGSVQFPIDEPLPLDLVTRIVRFRAEEDGAKAGGRRGRA